jgi:PAS domain-containing protein
LRVLDALSVGVFMVDAEGQPVYMNTAAERYLGRGLRRLDADQDLSAAYATYRAGTDALYPVEQLPLTRALRTRVPAHADDLEVRNPQ